MFNFFESTFGHDGGQSVTAGDSGDCSVYQKKTCLAYRLTDGHSSGDLCVNEVNPNVNSKEGCAPWCRQHVGACQGGNECWFQIIGQYCYIYSAGKLNNGNNCGTQTFTTTGYLVGTCPYWDCDDKYCSAGQRVVARASVRWDKSSAEPTCTGCPSGKYQSSSSHTNNDCSGCPSGKYQNQNGQSGCNPCTKGAGWDVAASAHGSNADSDCYASSCKKGYHRSASGTASTIECSPCSSLTWQPDDGHTGTTCDHNKGTCSAGQYYVRNGDAADRTCHSCGTGTYQIDSTHRTTSCDNCPEGQYQNALGQDHCENCPAGKFLTTKGNDALGDCDACTTSHVHSQAHDVTSAEASDASSDCKATSCKKGYFVTGSGSSTTCEACSAGQYQTTDGGTSCSSCSAGWITNTGTSTAASTCVKCAKGKFSTQSNVATCTSCSTGDYQPTDGQTSCTSCGYSWSLQNKQAQTTTTVGINNYRTGTGAYECINCQNGYDNQNGYQCDACAAGKYATSGNTCTNCNPGYITNRLANTGAWTCTACGATDTRTYSPNSQTACATCPSGSITARSSSDTAVVTYDATQCNACTTGKYSNDANTACATCGAGHVTARGTSTTSLVSSAATHCNACPVSHWTPNNQMACTLCPPGSETNTLTSVGASTCTACPAGEWTSDSSIACQAWSICPPGEYKVEHTDSSDGRCDVCVDGEFCPGGVESFVVVSSGHQDVTVSESECSAYATSIGKTYSTTISDQASNQWGNYIKGCQMDGSNVYWNPSTTSEIACGTGGNNCIQKKLGNVNDAYDPDFVGIRMFCAPESEGIDGIAVRSSHANSCVACNHGFTGNKRITETLTGLGDESLTSAECQVHAGSASFTEGDFADKPWGCSKVGDDYFWNERIYNTNIRCNDANTLCVQHVPDQGTADCSECPLGSYEVGGVCIPWQYTDQTECPDGAAFVIGNSGISSSCVTDFYYVPLDPSDGTLDLTIDSILCGADQALLDPQGNIVCTSCDRQGFLFIYGGPIVTTNPAYQRGPCCINSHHDVCTKMLDEYHLKCGASYTKSVNKCV